MTSMIQVGDTVVIESHSACMAEVTRPCPGLGLWYVHPEDGSGQAWRPGKKELIVADGDLILICAHPTCNLRAERFVRPGAHARAYAAGAPLCLNHHALDDYRVRPDPHALCTCGCGYNLDTLPGRDWTIGDTVAEYRHCPECNSDRAYIARDIIPGRTVSLTIDGIHQPPMYASFIDAMGTVNPGPGHELRRGDAILAKSIDSPTGRASAWRFLPPTRET